MGIYDRDYYRREGPNYLGTLIPSGRVCKWLIGLNIAIFLLQVLDRPAEPVFLRDDKGHLVLHNERRPSFTETFYLDTPKVVQNWQVWRLLTYAFLHDPHSIWHIFFNMLFLWWFGSELERMYGPKEFLAFYLCAALMGGLVGVGFYQLSHEQPPALGASGAVTALLVLFALHFPHQRIYLFFLLPVPIWLFVAFQVCQDTYSAVDSMRGSRLSAGAIHLSGAVFGFLYYRQHWQILGFLRFVRSWKLPRSRPRLRLYRPETLERESVPVPTTTVPSVLDEHLEAKLDAVLEKVARHGQGSLTDAERQILLKASEIYKRNRS